MLNNFKINNVSFGVKFNFLGSPNEAKEIFNKYLSTIQINNAQKKLDDDVYEKYSKDIITLSEKNPDLVLNITSQKSTRKGFSHSTYIFISNPNNGVVCKYTYSNGLSSFIKIISDLANETSEQAKQLFNSEVSPVVKAAQNLLAVTENTKKGKD